MYIYINIIKHGVVMPKYIDRCIYMLSYYYKQSSNDLTGISRKKSPPHLVSLIKVEGIFPHTLSHILTSLTQSRWFSVTYI